MCRGPEHHGAVPTSPWWWFWVVLEDKLSKTKRRKSASSAPLCLLLHFLLIPCEFHIKHLDPTHFSIPSHLISTLQTPTLIMFQNLYSNKILKEKNNKISHPGSCGGTLRVTQSLSDFSTYILTYLQVFITMSHWSGSRPAVFSTPQTLGSHWGSSWMDILLLSCVVEILYFWVCRGYSFTCVSKS